MPKRFLGLDGLRGVCALTVLLYHCSDFFHKGPILLHGFLAVDMFFILSGFVIALTYEGRLAQGWGPGRFLVARANRLFPTYWLGAIFNIVVFVGVATAGYIAGRDSWWMIWVLIPLTTLFVIPDYITPDGVLYPAMDSVAWSLFDEWGAYLVYCCGLFRLRTWAVALVAVCGWAAMTAYGIWTHKGWAGGGDRETLLTIGMLRCLPAFAAGIVIYRLHRHPFFQRLPEISTEILLVLWLCIAAIPRASATPLTDALIVTVFSPLLVCLLIRSERRAAPWCKRLGALSYPLYVVHPGFIVLATYTPLFGLSHGPRPLNGVVVVALSIALAWFVAELLPHLNVALGRLLRWPVAQPVAIPSQSRIPGAAAPRTS